VLADATVYVNLGSSDVERTIAFYEGTLGLPLVERRELLESRPEVIFRAGGALVCVEGGEGTPSPPTNPPFTFRVDDVEATAAALRERGVTFEEYDLPFLKTVDGIAEVRGSRRPGSGTPTATCSRSWRARARTSTAARAPGASGSASGSASRGALRDAGRGCDDVETAVCPRFAASVSSTSV
jgi:catechol 2,3-dioxygenase-like lactoylglutathione lyase family enzyme